MEDALVLNKSDIITDRKVWTNFNRIKLLPGENKNNFVIDHLKMEGGENFFFYINGLGLANESNMMVLSSRHNYYYDYNDLKGVTTLINMKRLNQIKHLNSFLNIVSKALPPRSNFIGCFSDWRSQKQKRIELPTKMYKGYAAGTVIEIDKNDVSGLLESYRLKVIDMTEINGLTYFRTENRRKIFN
jgi:hypothetical protein